MKKFYYILAAVIVIVLLFVLNKACNVPRGQGFKESEFAHQIRRVESMNGNQEITYKDQSSMVFSGLNWDNKEMDKFYGKNFSEFLFEGDSIYKEAGSLILKVVPVEGDPFELDVN